MATRTAAPTLPEIERARERLDGVARVTPVFPSETLSRLAGRPVRLKAENLQRTGSFKIRGAYTKVSSLDPGEHAAGVVAASAGNHGQAVAWAARELGAPARIFMPQDSPMAKVDATRNYGAEVELTGPAFEETLVEALEYVERTGATFVHPYEDTLVMAGQGTIGLELAEQVELETVVLPIGGGGLASGISVALRAVRPGLRIVGVQAAGTRPGGSGYTIADGIAVKEPGDVTMGILGETLDDFVTVEDEQIAEAIVLLAERTKLVVEGAGAVAVAAVLGDLVGGGSGPALALLSGGNIDASLMVQVMRRGLALHGRYLVLRTRVPDRPGELAKLLTLLAEERVNVVQVEHQRESATIPVGYTGVELTLLTRNPEHCEQLVSELGEWGYPAARLD
jgi:threonine dehydratase